MFLATEHLVKSVTHTCFKSTRSCQVHHVVSSLFNVELFSFKVQVQGVVGIFYDFTLERQKSAKSRKLHRCPIMYIFNICIIFIPVKA